MPFVVRGLVEAAQTLRALPGKFEQNSARRGMRRGVKVLQEGAKARVSRESGETAKAIKISVGVRKGMIRGKVQLRGHGSYKAWFLEFGVVPHWIAVSAEFRAQMKGDHAGGHSLKIGDRFVGPRVLHPGFKEGKFSFMRPTVDQEGDRAIQVMIAYVKSDIEAHGFNLPDNEQDDE